MHGFFTNVTAGLLALHTVLGCCWHHAHSCTQACATAATVAVGSVDACQGDRGHGDDTMPCSNDQGHHGRHDCQGSSCVFVNSLGASPQALALQIRTAPAALAPDGGPSVRDIAGQRPFYAADALLPPLRRHLVCQVLLI
jgi:hypothetical protein